MRLWPVFGTVFLASAKLPNKSPYASYWLEIWHILANLLGCMFRSVY
jgi:hypothetical protein